MSIQEQIDSLRTIQKCVFLAAEAGPAQDISDRCKKSADTMEAMLKVVEAANKMGYYRQSTALSDALAALKEQT